MMEEFTDEIFSECEYMVEIPKCIMNLAKNDKFERFPEQSKTNKSYIDFVLFNNFDYVLGPIRIVQTKYSESRCPTGNRIDYNNSTPKCFGKMVEGGVVDIYMLNESTIDEEIQNMILTNWIDSKTSKIEVLMNFINTNENLLFSVKVENTVDNTGLYNHKSRTLTGRVSNFYPPSVSKLIVV